MPGGAPRVGTATSAGTAGTATGAGTATSTGTAVGAGDADAAGAQTQSATDRGGLTALAAALRSMTAARPIVTVAGKSNRPPSGRPLVMLCLWATMLGLVGLGIGVRGLIVIIASHPASWFKPTLIISGLGGILLTACGFVTARRGLLPWIFLGAATAVLIVSVVFSAAV